MQIITITVVPSLIHEWFLFYAALTLIKLCFHSLDQESQLCGEIEPLVVTLCCKFSIAMWPCRIDIILKMILGPSWIKKV